MQGLALFLYLWFDGLTSLFIVTGIFGLFQGGIVPMYAVIIREYLPAREAGVRIGLVMSSTILGMAFGGYVSGAIFDAFASYRAAFLNGLAWKPRQSCDRLLAHDAGKAGGQLSRRRLSDASHRDGRRLTA